MNSSTSLRDNSTGRTTRITLERNGKRVEVSKQQVTTDNLRKMFQVQPTDIWLREDCPESVDGTAFFPDESGQFHLAEVTSFCTLIVEGTTYTGLARNEPSPAPARSTGISVPVALTPPPLFKAVASAKKPASTIIKIMQARLSYKKNKAEFSCTGQIHVEITESTANVHSISEAVCNQLGADYTIVTTEGFEIVDCPATRGTAFWKAPRRKLYAVNHTDMQSSLHAVDHVEDSDDELPARKRQKNDMMVQLTGEVKSIRDTLNNILQKHTITRDWRQLLCEHFKCQICQGIITPPITVSTCCCTVLGCQECIARWYGGSEACPTCRSEQDENSTTTLRGFNELLDKIKVLTQEDDA